MVLYSEMSKEESGSNNEHAGEVGECTCISRGRKETTLR